MRLLVLCAALLLAALAHGAEVVLEDPAGDDNGPGTYAYPAVEGFRPGSFDLRTVRIRERGDGADIEVTFQSAVELVPARLRQDMPPRTVFMPVVDIYASSGPAAGHQELLPGRRVEPAVPWDKAVVVSLAGDVLEAHYRAVAADLARDVCFPRNVVVLGKTVRVHCPRRCLPADITRAGWLVLVTGLGPGAGLKGMVMDSVRGRGKDAQDPFVREVAPTVGSCNVWEDGSGVSACTFGGCAPCDFAPFVLDVVVPEGQSQRDLLRAYSPGLRRLATLPFVFPSGGPVAEPPRPLEARWPVVAVRGRELSVRVDENAGRYQPGALGAIICPGDRPLDSVVVKGMAAGFLVVERVSDDSPVCEGAFVVF